MSKNVMIHEDARARINKITAVRLAKRSTLKRLGITGVAAVATTAGVVGCNEGEVIAPTPRFPENTRKTDIGVISGIFGSLAAIGTVAAGTWSLLGGEKYYSAKEGNNRYYKGYNLQCQQIMSSKERIEIVQQVHKLSYDDAALLLSSFESQEAARQAIETAKKEETQAGKLPYSRRHGYGQSEVKEEVPLPPDLS